MIKFLLYIHTDDGFTGMHHMEANQKAFYKSYFFHDDLTRCFLTDLSVSPEFRRQKIGSFAIVLHEKAARSSGFKYSLLFVDKNSWMEDWYKRLGYAFHEEKDEKQNWLIKEL